MISKKHIPLDLLKAIEEIAQENLDIIKLQHENNTYYSFIETDINSKNFFKIFIDGKKIIGNFDARNYAFFRRPQNETRAEGGLSQGTLPFVISQFQKWITIIRTLNDTKSVYDDEFTKKYSEFYFSEFKIVDEDANTAPFNPEQQDVIELYLDSLAQSIESSNDEIDTATKEELVTDLRDIKAKLSTSTKNQVMRSIATIYGKLYKISKAFAKEIVADGKKRLIRGLFDAGIIYGPKLLEMVKDL